MRPVFAAALCSLALLSATALVTLVSTAHAAFDPVRSVDPFIGTAGHGHTFPGATVPFGMVQLSPDTRLDGWDGCSGYHDDDRVVYGFSHTHLSGTGVGDYGDILLFPGIGTPQWRNSYGRKPGEGYGSPFDKRTESASPGYYAVTLEDSRIRAELTATARTGWHRYTFPATDSAFVLLDLTHRDEVLESSAHLVDDHTIAGFRRSRAWARDQRVYFVARFSQPVRALFAVDGTPRPGLREASGRDVRVALQLGRPNGPLTIRVGISAVDEAGARAALDAEAGAGSFDATRAAAREAWRVALSRIEVTGGTPQQDTVFYTALYHTLLQPNLYTDVDGRYRGRDGQVHTTQGWTQYTVFSLWDTFRAAHPLYTLLEPARSNDFVNTFLAQYREGGRLPVWELAGNETDCMIGDHAISVIADAYAKGIRGFDAQQALAAMRASADADDRGRADFRLRGHVRGERESESVSKTLEYAYNAACVSRFARALGRDSVAAEYALRAQGWRHILDPATGFMRPRIHARFKTPFDPREVDFHFTEANSWQYSFFVPHDIEAHMSALGGPAAYAAKLDSLFAAPAQTTGRDQADITGLIGQYAHGNEPSHHIAYLYSYAGQPWRTQQVVRRILDSLYTARRDGLAGNEDCGQMSAWYVLSALGLYAVDPGQDTWAIGTPLFPRATLHLPNGRDFVITRTGGKRGTPYIRSATLGKQPLPRAYLRHAEIVAGGALAFAMSDTPDTTWGRGDGRTPRSRMEGPRVTAAPYVVSGDARFRGRPRIVLASADSMFSIRFSLTDRGQQELMGALAPDSAVGTISLPLPDTTCILRFLAVSRDFEPSPLQQVKFVHLEGNRRIVSCTTPHRAYTADGPDALIDGIRGGDDFRVPSWMGFYGVDMDVVVDLGETRTIQKLGCGFLQDQNSWIFMPRAATFATSLDGVAFTPVGRADNTVDEHADGVVTQDLSVAFAPRKARYLKVQGIAPVMCPGWHKGAGNRSFIFADEIVFE